MIVYKIIRNAACITALLLAAPSSQPLFASGNPAQRELIRKLVAERKEKFGDYADAAEKKSGFFGNKTKKDLNKQVDILSEIIRFDNRIILMLGTYLDYSNFQKTEMTYTNKDAEERAEKLSQLTESLSAKVTAQEDHVKQLRRSQRLSSLLNYILLGVCGWFGWRNWKLRKVRAS